MFGSVFCRPQPLINYTAYHPGYFWGTHPKVSYELRFIDDNEKASVKDFFMPGFRD